MYKVIIIGDSEVGKTSLIKRFTTDEFSEEYVPTIHNRLSKSKTKDNESKTFELQIWDTIGNERLVIIEFFYNNYRKIRYFCYCL